MVFFLLIIFFLYGFPIRAPNCSGSYTCEYSYAAPISLNFSNYTFSLQNMVAVTLGSFIAVFHLCLVQLGHGGAYFGRNQPPQPLPQYNDGFPQQPFKGNEMPRVMHGKNVPALPQYGKEHPQLPLQMGKEGLSIHGKGSCGLRCD